MNSAQQTQTPIENLPKAARVFQALRSMGYSLNAAVADVGDNSITAGRAKRIDILFVRSEGQFTLSICDDGVGMSRDELVEAMSLGSEGSYEEEDLGKFGMGMKTASLSQCRKLTVASRTNLSGKSIFSWDLDHIDRTNRWHMLEINIGDISQHPHFSKLNNISGTVVLWENMDHLRNELAGLSDRTQYNQYVGTLLHELELHLRMTFHRFLDGSLGEHATVEMYLNETKLQPWDPFCREEKNIQVIEPFDFTLSESNSIKGVTIEPYVLPTKDGERGFSSQAAWEDAKGLLSWNDSQGYYIYRANRLIHYGGWLRTRAKDEHTKYARVAINFMPEHDDAFDISVQKNRIKLPRSLSQFLKQEVNPEVIERSQAPYRKKTPEESRLRHKKSSILVEKTVQKVMPKRSIEIGQRGGQIVVQNSYGVVPMNSLKDALRINLKNRFGIEIEELKSDDLWELVCKPDGGFVIVLNSNHDFYRNIYEVNEKNKKLIKFMDSILFSLAYAELYSISVGTKDLFDEVRSTMSIILEELANEEGE